MPSAQNYYPDCPEALIVSLARDGNRQAFEELVKRRQSSIRNLMRRCCGDPALADDLAQQTFIKAWISLRFLREIDAFPGWLKKIAISIWLQHLRKKDALNSTKEHDEIESVVKTSNGLKLDLDSALAKLPDIVRLCVVLSYNEGMSHSEIAKLSNCPLGTVKSHINRGSEKLRQLLSDYQKS